MVRFGRQYGTEWSRDGRYCIAGLVILTTEVRKIRRTHLKKREVYGVLGDGRCSEKKSLRCTVTMA